MQSVFDLALNGRPDAKILQHAYADGRVILTHDSDFGLIADIAPPFIAVAERRENETRVRVRRHLV